MLNIVLSTSSRTLTFPFPVPSPLCASKDVISETVFPSRARFCVVTYAGIDNGWAARRSFWVVETLYNPNSKRQLTHFQ